MSRLCIPLTNEQQKQIKIKSAEVGLSMAEIARRFLLAWLAGDMLTYGEINTLEMFLDKNSDEFRKLERMREWATK